MALVEGAERNCRSGSTPIFCRRKSYLTLVPGNEDAQAARDQIAVWNLNANEILRYR
jgi:hypothetical protein